jgi:16S rRNA A1518/A1519 N6-dimethyltransferase RsmA/KsgA/DIM1 with predicted DNA glycosylase/AP lyase activity
MNDVLQVDFTQAFGFDLSKSLVYGSLPYYITSPIIGKLFLPKSIDDGRSKLTSLQPSY